MLHLKYPGNVSPNYPEEAVMKSYKVNECRADRVPGDLSEEKPLQQRQLWS